MTLGSIAGLRTGTHLLSIGKYLYMCDACVEQLPSPEHAMSRPPVETAICALVEPGPETKKQPH